MTHLLTGACMGRAGANRATALATATMVVAAEFPDIDVLWYLRGPVSGFAHHRGFTHTLLGSPLMAATVVALVYLFHKARLRNARGNARGRDLPRSPHWGRLFLFAWVATLSHILLDFANHYGVRPFAPFYPRWFSWDIVFIVEPVILVMLFLGLVIPSLLGLVQEEISGRKQRGPRGRRAAILALVGVVLLLWFRDFEHRRALAAMNSVLYRGETPRKFAAYPYPSNPFKWLGVVETEDFFQVMRVNSSPPEVDPQGNARIFFKPVESEAALAAKHSRLGRVYLDWARFPVLETEPRQPAGSGFTVRFRDLRFVYPERASLGAAVELDKNLNVVLERFGQHEEKPR